MTFIKKVAGVYVNGATLKDQVQSILTEIDQGELIERKGIVVLDKLFPGTSFKDDVKEFMSNPKIEIEDMTKRIYEKGQATVLNKVETINPEY